MRRERPDSGRWGDVSGEAESRDPWALARRRRSDYAELRREATAERNRILSILRSQVSIAWQGDRCIARLKTPTGRTLRCDIIRQPRRQRNAIELRARKDVVEEWWSLSVSNGWKVDINTLRRCAP